jgi:hydrogenase maturation protease
MKILLYGYGNPGRQDDGLGNAFINDIEEWVKKQGLEGFSFDSNYQLNIEDALEISNYDLVIFVDASVEEIEDFCISKVDASTKVTFTTHAASPGYVVGLCKKMYNKAPVTLLLHIKGYEWKLDEGLTEKAKQNLEKAIIYFKEKLSTPEALLDSDVELKKCD